MRRALQQYTLICFERFLVGSNYYTMPMIRYIQTSDLKKATANYKVAVIVEGWATSYDVNSIQDGQVKL